MATKTLRTWVFKDPVYGMGYILHRGTWDAAQKYLQRYANAEPCTEPIDEHLVALTTLMQTDTTRFVHLWFPKFSPRNMRHLSTLAHECLHATLMTFDIVGIPVDSEHDEAAAYYLAWLYEECYRRLTDR